MVEQNAGGDGYSLRVRVKDLLTYGEELEVPADLVVLAVGMEPNNLSDLVALMKLPVGEDRFLQEVHPKLRPVELAIPGVLLAGTCQAPMDVGEACAAASAAAVKAAAVLSRGYVELDPFVAEVDLEKCQGTGACVAACLREGALSLAEEMVDGDRSAGPRSIRPSAWVAAPASPCAPRGPFRSRAGPSANTRPWWTPSSRMTSRIRSAPMEPEGQDQTLRKEAMKKLREGRKLTIAAATARMKEQKKAIAAIKSELQQGDKTVPEIAAATGLPAAEVLWYVAALKKYGEVLEGPLDGSYYRYRLAQPAAAETDPGLSE